MENIINNYLNSLYNRNTISSYRQDLDVLLKFIGPCSSPKFLTVDKFISYRDFLIEKNLSSATITRRFATYKSFIKWCTSQSLIESSPLDTIKLPKASVQNPTLAFLDEEVKKIIEASKDNAMHHLLLTLLFNLGLRRSELINIKLKDFQEDRSGLVLNIKGKGGKTRRLPINSTLKLLMDKFLSISNKRTVFLFKSKIDENRSITAHSVYRIVNRYAKQVGIDRRVGAHSCRATAISHLLEKGVSPRDVADFAGHTSINTTINSYDKKRDGLSNSAALKISY